MIPTQEECWDLVQRSEAFECLEREVNGYKVRMYNYLLADYHDFKDNNAFELRGLTFVYDPDTNEWERHLLLTKFFNLNQVQDFMLEDVKHKKIVRIQEKADGSIISFVRFPNGKILAKSKMSFESDQAKMAQEIYDHSKDLQDAIEFANDMDEILIFELISPLNQIVLNYINTELILLQVRNSKTGEYKNHKLKAYRDVFRLKIVESQEITTFEELLEKKKDLKDKEGWVVTLEDGQMLKIKTDWYMEMHFLIGDDAMRENVLIESILNETIDDVIAQLGECQKRDIILDTQKKIKHKFNNYLNQFLLLRGLYFNKYNEDRKSFAIKYKHRDVFPLVMKTLNLNKNIEQKAKELIKEFILKKTYKLQKAKEFLND